ncbi:four helix bundle protein [Anaerophaga thermohalophila]|uniref:four helix bundle protein n=1 Tax=Anaerophaga thermohalophila TaxID=177400 RepID=UPI000237BCF2|nr:four helix bundle protein [Anaerophaga thermohalophila]
MENFSFKKLLVWQKGMTFAEKCLDITETLKGHYRLIEQLEAAAASVPQNIAEGEGRISVKENINYLYISRGSLYESITVLNLLYYKNLISKETLDEQETIAIEITKMISALITQKRKQIM